MVDYLIPPAPSFNDPLEMLHACHGRIKSHCATLQKLAKHLPEHGCDEQVQQAARHILRYFDSAGKHHHEDEEKDLFPLLCEVAKRHQDAELVQVIGNLIAEHRAMEQQWSALRPLLIAIAGGENVALSSAAIERFSALYTGHIANEERRLFSKAAKLLEKAQIERLGRAMAARRNVSFIPD